ncbi:MAG: biosynthetic peptidoglycan transglycosylase [Geobacter sp.]|nr:biosynthetic peptidoglycan transglycosylase [Trichlorobacter sp.]MDY0383789.1 biosynthetic peptidoglycan transglycosylase [Trichlorobacter sp.]
MPVKKFLIAGGVVCSLYLAYIIISLALLPPIKQLTDRKTSMTIEVRDWKGKERSFVLGPKNRYWTSSGRIAPEMKWAVILAEDGNFYKHEGIDVKAIKQAIKHDLEKKSLAKGASTITQQVAKNVYLSREKTISRKLKEVYLAWRMEQELTKGRILELYLNVVELGPMVYGIGHGSRYYFGKSPAELTPRESAFLAAMLPGPRVAYNPYRNLGKVLRRSNMILRNMRAKGVISADEYQTALAQAPNIGGLQRKVDFSLQQELIQQPQSSSQQAPQAEPAVEAEPVPVQGETAPAAEGALPTLPEQQVPVAGPSGGE